jgi:hypothetical protein
MLRNLLLSAGVICILGVDTAQADIFISLDGEDLTDSIVLSDYPGQFIVAVEGDTSFEPNDIMVEAENGTLEPVDDGNNSYYFQFIAEGEATVNLITKVYMTIDGQNIPADTLIYQLWMCYNPYINLYAAFGIGLADLFIPPEEEDLQQGEMPSEDISEATEIILEEEPNELEAEPLPEIDYNLPSPKSSKRELQKVLLNCPNNLSGSMYDWLSPDNYQSQEYTNSVPDDGFALKASLIHNRYEQMLEDEEPNIIVIDSDITTNQIWTADNIYYITRPTWEDPPVVGISALLVIEPGTIVMFDPDMTMDVFNGGTLIACGTPDKLIYFTYYPYHGDMGTCSIWIEPTASPSTKISYCLIDSAFLGIVTEDIRLDNPIQNNYFVYSYVGIGEVGTKHTDIINNAIYDSYDSAINVYMSYPYPYEQEDANSHILIKNNTCHVQMGGIVIHGVENPENAGWVELINNIVSDSCDCGLVFIDLPIYATVANTGYYNNSYNFNLDPNDFNEINPVYETENPYNMRSTYLRQDCNFIDAGCEYIEESGLIGRSTDINGLPDSNIVDLGFHDLFWNYSNAGEGNTLSSDLNHDSIVNFKDYAILAADWQTDYNINDLNTMSDQWLLYGEPNIQIQIIGDSNNGHVDIGVNGWTADTMQIFLLVDGQYKGEIVLFEDNQTFRLDISALGNSPHELKTIGIDINDNVICSNLTQTSFICPFKYCTQNESYVQNQPYYFSSFYPDSDNVTVKVFDEDNILVWSQIYPAQNLNGFIPSSITSRDDLDAIVFEPTSGGSSAITKPLAMAFIPWLVPSNIRALILLPDEEQNKLHKDVVETIESAFENRGVPYYKLKLKNANFKYLSWFAMNRYIEYIYFNGHGHYRIGQIGYGHSVLRTNIVLSDGKVVSAKKSDFLPGSEPPWCEEMPGTLEKITNSITSISYYLPGLKFVQFESCFSGHLRLTSDYRLVEGDPGQQGFFDIPNSDMSYALRMLGAFDQFYQGWFELTSSAPPYKNFSIDEWTRLKEGDNLYEAMQYAISRGDQEALDNLRIYGMGLMLAVKIE